MTKRQLDHNNESTNKMAKLETIFPSNIDPDQNVDRKSTHARSSSRYNFNYL